MIVNVKDTSGDYMMVYKNVLTVVESPDIFIVCNADGTTATYHWEDDDRRWTWEQQMPFYV